MGRGGCDAGEACRKEKPSFCPTSSTPATQVYLPRPLFPAGSCQGHQGQTTTVENLCGERGRRQTENCPQPSGCEGRGEKRERSLGVLGVKLWLYPGALHTYGRGELCERGPACMQITQEC